MAGAISYTKICMQRYATLNALFKFRECIQRIVSKAVTVISTNFRLHTLTT